MPLLLVSSPPVTTSHTTSVSEEDSTFSSMAPSASRMVSPVRTLWGRSG